MTDTPSPSPAPPEELFDADTLEAARVLFAREVSFLMGAAKIEQLCAAEQRLAEAEDKVALVRAGMELRQ